MVQFSVLKFGGTSVASAARWQTISAVVQTRLSEKETPVLVCSALAKVSDTLEELLAGAEKGDIEAYLIRIEELHCSLETNLGLERSDDVKELLGDLKNLTLGASLTREVTPRLRARVMSAGELLSTRIGANYLQKQGIRVAFVDARSCLQATSAPHESDGSRFLSAQCDFASDEELQKRFSEYDAVITQGFIARDEQGATVLLGRGGSDTSAAYFAAKLNALRCEIWTDVPGVFTANPHEVPTARLLRSLDYDEAQEIATTGAKVLHPRCLGPLRQANIPLQVCCTKDPDLKGTRVSTLREDGPAQVKAISARRGITLVSMDTLGMWQQIGFLADAFGIFKTCGVSVDLVSTSESNVTVSIDAGAVDDETLSRLLQELNVLCRAKLIESCAAVSIVGRNIRAILHQIGPALAVFEERKIHLLSQAASDLNLTLVIDEDDAPRMVNELHALLFGERPQDALLGPTWKAIFANDDKMSCQASNNGHGNDDTGQNNFANAEPWWIKKQDELVALAEQGTPTYAYDLDKVAAQADALMALSQLDRRFFAIKANHHPRILNVIYDAGFGLECVSPGELEHVFSVVPDLEKERVLFTPNFAGREEYEAAFARGAHVTVDNAHPLEAWPDVFAGQEVMLRLDPGRGQGHHPHVKTAGKQSKFGIAPEDFADVAELVKKAKVVVKGLHTHAGSGITQPYAWQETALFLKDAMEYFPDVRIFDLGGGLGIVEKPGRAPLDLHVVNESLKSVKEMLPNIELWMEPGRFLTAEAGVLLGRVQQLKTKGDVNYVGIDVGMHTLVRPALYGAFHQIVNLSRLNDEPTQVAHVVGPICETGDVVGHQRSLPPTEEGDVVLIATAGAYGRTMSSNYNLRGWAKEGFVKR
ncbi:MAG: bifunctional aspartate kinase/diaminopimelate decarboxylase [Deltaproteobacteria bacterium]|nr:bifunctional aspartate kinase/diaminopimelate decarboxylase [Deltaproteobacteria bacterium]